MSRQPYQPVEDIPDIERMFLDAPDTDAVMHRIIRSTRYALTRPSHLRARSDYRQQVSEVIDEQLLMFGITHASIRRPSFTRGNPKVFVSRYAERVLEFGWTNPSAPNPSWFKRSKYGNNVERYIRNYFDFPTPGQAAGKLTNPLLKRFLFRWHKEYTFLSQYTHVRVGKLRFAGMHREKRMMQEGIKEYGLNYAARAIVASYSATATACALVLKKV